MKKPRSKVTYIRKGDTPGNYKVIRVTVRPDGTYKKDTIGKNLTKLKADEMIFNKTRNIKPSK